MKYKIRIVKEAIFKATSGRKLIEISKNSDSLEEDDSVMGLYDNLRTREYPKFLNDTIRGNGAYSIESSFFSGPSDEDGEIVKEDEVYFYCNRTATIISVDEFEHLNIELAHKLLEAVTLFNLKDLGHVNQQWTDDIKNWITKKEF